VKAVQLVEYGRLELVDLPTPVPTDDEVLIRVRACGICGSDVHGMDGSTGRRVPPIVMGHEAAGEIIEAGSAAHSWNPGDRVTFDSTIYCGVCEYCRRWQVNLCERRQVIGVSCPEYRRQGAFAELIVVPQRVLHPLPENLSFEAAAMAEPVSVALHGVTRSGMQPADRVAVIGAGMIGLLIIQVLRAKGAAEIVVVDIDAEKLKLAKELGATDTRSTTADLGLDIAIEAVGISETVEMAIRSVRKGGAVALVGNISPQVNIPLQAVVTRELSLYGCCASQGDYPESLDLIATRAVNVDPLISARISLEQTPEYFRRLYEREPGLMKVLVCP
jgi:L-iditol 2-dehydrogenase